MYRASIRSQVVRILLQELSAARKGGTVGVDCAYMMRLLKGEGQRCADFGLMRLSRFLGRGQLDLCHIATIATYGVLHIFILYSCMVILNWPFPTSPFLRLHFLPVHQDGVP